MQVLHITAHLGGGVGRALSALIAQASVSGSEFKHTIVCLEKPEKTQFLDKIRGYGAEAVVCPSMAELEKLMNCSDIVQLEWWNHPATIKYLCSLSIPPIRLLTWSHVSGLHTPIIPKQLIAASQIFLFTSPCSFECKEVKSLLPKFEKRVGVVYSSGGFSGLPEPHDGTKECVSVGYFGSLNFAKLHPHYVDYMAAVKIPGFRVKIIGDLCNQDILEQQCNEIGKAGMLEFTGYVPDIAYELGSLNVLAYLLNPEHYGTTENALLEAMAMGIVPIVLDNPAERYIVDDRDTGLIIHSPKEFAEAIHWLSEKPAERQRMGNRAAKSVRERFSTEKAESALNAYYRKILSVKKREINFIKIFGNDPAEWFLSCQKGKSIFAEGGKIHLDSANRRYGLFEKHKGTVFHFSEYFPDNSELKSWAKNLRLMQ